MSQPPAVRALLLGESTHSTVLSNQDQSDGRYNRICDAYIPFLSDLEFCEF